MELSAAILTPTLLFFGAAFYAAGLLWTLSRAPWSWFQRDGAANRFAASTLAVLMVWQLRAALEGGPAVHLLGATLLTLAFGWRLAVIALSIVLLFTTAITTGDWRSVGVNGALLVLFAVGVSYAVARATERLLPRHLFVYLFVSAFFGAALAIAAVSYATLGVAGAAGVMSTHALSGNYRPMTLLLLFPEAFITGALVTLGAIYRPQWLVSFCERRYLDDRNGTGA
jgi:uncharacterized membrane protein